MINHKYQEGQKVKVVNLVPNSEFVHDDTQSWIGMSGTVFRCGSDQDRPCYALHVEVSPLPQAHKLTQWFLETELRAAGEGEQMELFT